MNKYIDVNREMWDALVPVHMASKLYDVDRFKRGARTLLDIEREEVGDVHGKSLLHLQCHFGLDTLSWQRLGARVTGADFSEKAIAQAQELSRELDIPARFVRSAISELPSCLSGKFDIVFTSAGVLCWLPDLANWAEVIAHFLKPNGMFYLREFHPFAGVFDDDEEISVPSLRYPYFDSGEPLRFENDGSYADPDAPIHTVDYEWVHSFSDIINALIGAGLRIEFIHEFPFCGYKSLPFLVKDEDGLWRLPDNPNGLPLMFSLRAIRE